MAKREAEPFRWKLKASTIATLTLILCLTSWWALVRFIPTWDDRSNFGQMFGAINALFSGLALAGVVLALFMQKNELELQREELVATRDELRRSADAQTATSTAFAQQINLMQMTARLNALTGTISSLFDHPGRTMTLGNHHNVAAETIATAMLLEVSELLTRLRAMDVDH